MEKPTSWVYFLRSGEAGPIKIGYTGNSPLARLSALQTGNPETIRLIGAVPGDREDESRLHNRFASVRMTGEWFQPSVELLAFIDGALMGCREQPSYDEMLDWSAWMDTVAEYSGLRHAVERIDAIETCDGVAEMDGGTLDAHSLAELHTHIETLRYSQVVHGDGMLRFGREHVGCAIERAESVCSRQGAMYGLTRDQVAFIGTVWEVRRWEDDLRAALVSLTTLRKEAGLDRKDEFGPVPLPLTPAARRNVAVAWMSGVKFVGPFFTEGRSARDEMFRTAYGAMFDTSDLEPVRARLRFFLTLLLGSENPPPASVIPGWLHSAFAEAA